MKNLLFLLLFVSLSGFSQTKIPLRRTVDCILMAGQSNMEGGDVNGTPTATYLMQPHTYIFYKPNDAGSTNNGSYQTLGYGLNQLWRASQLSSYCGPEITVGYNYFQSTGNPLAIIKYGYSGSVLVDDGTVSTSGYWQWDADPANCNGLPHYTNFVNNFIIPCILKCRANGIDLNIKALHWMQGEGDANSGTSFRPDNYEDVLIEMIDKLVTDLTPYNVLDPNFKPIISRIHNNFSPARPYQNDIRTALVNVSTHYSGYWIDTDAYPLNADNIHYTKPGQETHGADVCTKYLLIP